MIAAVAHLEGGDATGSAFDHALSIGYALESAGAPGDYRAALGHRGGTAFARRALSLAESFRGGVSASEQLPAERGPLDPPVRSKIVAGFGQLYGRPHLGIDFSAREETSVAAAAAGVVTEVGAVPAYGRYICLIHRFPDGLRGSRALNTCYGYLREPLLEPGDSVERGEAVGLSGCTGGCISPRVHFVVRPGPRPDALPVDPAPYLRG